MDLRHNSKGMTYYAPKTWGNILQSQEEDNGFQNYERKGRSTGEAWNKESEKKKKEQSDRIEKSKNKSI